MNFTNLQKKWIIFFCILHFSFSFRYPSIDIMVFIMLEWVLFIKDSKDRKFFCIKTAERGMISKLVCFLSYHCEDAIVFWENIHKQIDKTKECWQQTLHKSTTFLGWTAWNSISMLSFTDKINNEEKKMINIFVSFLSFFFYCILWCPVLLCAVCTVQPS